jgi:quinol monooxygenase YgiN
MILEYIRYVIPPERGDEFVAAYRSASSVLDGSEHCLGYELSRGIEEPENWILRINWDSREGHEQGFRSSPGFRSFFEAVRPFFEDVQEMKHYQPTEVASAT